MKVLVAGMGNVLRGDDGFGVQVAQRLLEGPVPADVRVVEVGIGGIHLVHELHAGLHALVVVDAVELGRPPGTVAVIRPEVREPDGRDDLADMHYATPERALMLAGALRWLPPELWLVGCQPADADRLGEGLSPELDRAVVAAAAEVRILVSALGVPWPDGQSEP